MVQLELRQVQFPNAPEGLAQKSLQERFLIEVSQTPDSFNLLRSEKSRSMVTARSQGATYRALSEQFDTTIPNAYQTVQRAIRTLWRTNSLDIQIRYPLDETLHSAIPAETRAKISQAKKGRPSPWKGRHPAAKQ